MSFYVLMEVQIIVRYFLRTWQSICIFVGVILNNRNMRKFYLHIVTVVAFLFLAGCNNANNGNDDKKVEIDTAAYVLQVLDSLEKGGVAYHKENWEIGIFGYEFNRIKVNANRVALSSDTLYFVNLECKKYKYESAIIPETEISKFREVIKSMIDNSKRDVETPEHYTYTSKSGLMLNMNLVNEKGKYDMSMFLNGKNSDNLFIFRDDLIKLDSLLCQAQMKINTLRKK